MTPPFPAWEFRVAERAEICIMPVIVLALAPATRQAQVLAVIRGDKLKTWMSYDRLVTSPQVAADKVRSELSRQIRILAREPAQPSVPGRASA